MKELDAVHEFHSYGAGFPEPRAATVTNPGRFAMRWPGHCAFWYALAQLGFLEQGPIPVGTTRVAPREFVRSLLEPQLRYADDEREEGDW